MRNYEDPAYTKWRRAVMSRDGRKCRKCGSRRGLQIHHIQKWASVPALRYSVPNGITLCRKCHGQLWGKEELFEAACKQLLMPRDIFIKIQLAIRGFQDGQIQGDSG